MNPTDSHMEYERDEFLSILTDLIEGVRDFADDSVWEDNPDIGLLELADRAEARLREMTGDE